MEVANKKVVEWNELSKEQQEAFTENGKIPVIFWLIEDEIGTTKFYSKEDVEREVEKTRRGEVGSAPDTEAFLYDCFSRYPIAGKSVAIIGSTGPRYEGICLAYGGRPTVIDYNKLSSNDDRINFMTVEEYQKNPIQFDAVLSISTYEHDGLGRYGDPINPNGDLEAMVEVREKMLKDNGLLYLAVPVGIDTLVWNAHRIYGPIRVPKLFQGFEPIYQKGWPKEWHWMGTSCYQPVVVLKKEKVLTI